MARAADRPRNLIRRAVGRAVCVGVSAGADAGLFAALALERGFVEPVLLLGQKATRATVRATLLEMAALSEPGDLFLLTFAGHGGRRRVRVSGDESREVGTWQLYDGTLNDEQLKSDLARFRHGARVLVISDSCCGGIPALGPTDLKASVLVFAACEEGQYADGAGLPGHFSGLLRRTLNESAFHGSYGELHDALCSGMPPYQRPGYYRLGISDAAFEAQRPLTI
jgi:metacaspase-1